MTNFESESRQGHTGSLRRRIWLASVVGGSLVVGLTAGIVMAESGTPSVAGASGATTAPLLQAIINLVLGEMEVAGGETTASGKVASVTPSAIEASPAPTALQPGSRLTPPQCSNSWQCVGVRDQAWQRRPGLRPPPNSTINASTLVFWKCKL